MPIPLSPLPLSLPFSLPPPSPSLSVRFPPLGLAWLRRSSFDASTGTLRLRLAGSCQGCSHSAATLKDGIERLMTFYVPEVTAVVHVNDTPLDRVNRDALSELEAKLARQEG